MHMLFLVAPLRGTGCPRPEGLVGKNCAEAVSKEPGRTSACQPSGGTLVGSGSGIRRGREPSLPLPGRLCIRPVQTLCIGSLLPLAFLPRLGVEFVIT